MPPLGGESMNRTTWLQDRRMEKFSDVLSRWKARELSAQEAGEVLGCSERQFRRYRRRYEGPFGQFYAREGERRGGQEELACGHDVMLDMPNELTALLQRT